MEREELNLHLENRITQLREAKEKGAKVVGYFPGNYVPEEIIYASGAVPICLASASSQHATAALVEVPDVICPFARAQIGHKLLKTDRYYSMADLVIAPLTCVHMKDVAEIWEYYCTGEIFKLGVPRQHDSDFGLEYYIDRLHVLKDRLQSLTGNVITDERLADAIDLYNRIRESLRNIDSLRRGSHPPINSIDFIKLNHAAFFADPSLYAEVLEGLYERLKMQQGPEDGNLPRLFLVGPNLSHGDYSVIELVGSAGGSIVAEEIFEGMKQYSQDIKKSDDLIRSLATGYLRDRIPSALMRNSVAKRFAYAMKLVKEYNIQGVIWYQLVNCEVYDAESYLFTQKMKEHNIPVLVLESDYEAVGPRQMRLRIEAFLEQIKGVQ